MPKLTNNFELNYIVTCGQKWVNSCSHEQNTLLHIKQVVHDQKALVHHADLVTRKLFTVYRSYAFHSTSLVTVGTLPP